MATGARVPVPPPPADPRSGITSTPDQYASLLVLIQQPGAKGGGLLPAIKEPEKDT